MGHHQDGDTDYSWHCFPVKEEQFIAIQEQDTTERTLEYEGEAEAAPWTSVMKTDFMRR